MFIIEATNEKVESFMGAIKIATANNCNVIDAKNGLVRWTPPAHVSAKKMREYQERKNARAAYEKMIANKIA